MKQYSKTTLQYLDRAVRASVGALIIITVLMFDNVAPWVAILGAYPIFTAVYGYDLLYSGLKILLSILRGQAGESGDFITTQSSRPAM